MKKVSLLYALAFSVFIISCSSSKNTSATTSEETTATNTNELAVEKQNVIVMVNTASWCGVCRSNGPRVEEEILSKYMKDEHYQIVVNNLSDEATITESNKTLEKAGILDFANNNNGTGLIYILNANSKEMISKISVSKSTEKIEIALNEAIIS